MVKKDNYSLEAEKTLKLQNFRLTQHLIPLQLKHSVLISYCIREGI